MEFHQNISQNALSFLVKKYYISKLTVAQKITPYSLTWDLFFCDVSSHLDLYINTVDQSDNKQKS